MKKAIIVIMVLAALGLAGGGYYFFFQSKGAARQANDVGIVRDLPNQFDAGKPAGNAPATSITEQAAIPLIITATTPSVKVGTKFPVTVATKEPVISLLAIQLSLTYDPKVLKAVSVTKGDVWANPTIIESRIADSKGMVSYAMGKPFSLKDKKLSSVGSTILTVQFEAVAAGTSDMNLTDATKITREGIVGYSKAQVNPITVSVN